MKTMPSDQKVEQKVEKFIVFIIAGYHFALPVRQVLQIVNFPPTTTDLSKAGLVQIGRHLIRLLDLHQQLEGCDRPPAHRPFLVITPMSLTELCAIPVSEPPNLIELSLDLIRTLPQSSCESGALKLASHAATLPINDTPTTVFLLSSKRMLTPIAALP